MSHPYEALGSVYDDFRTVAATTVISGRTSDSGHTWVQYRGTWTVQTPSGGADGNVAAAAPSTTRSRVGIDFGVSDVEVEGTFWMIAPANRGGLMVRRTASGYYSCAGASSVLRLTRSTDGGSDTLLAEGTNALNDLEENVIKVICSGSTIDCYLNGVLEISVTDSTYNGTIHGLWQSFGGVANVAALAFNMHPSTTPPWSVGSVKF